MRTLSILVFIALMCNAIAAPLSFENSLQSAFERAKAENKPLFVEYYESDCPICMRVNKLFETDEQLIGFYQNSFVNYRIDTHHFISSDSLFIAKTKLKFYSVPYFLFFDTNQQLLHVSAIKLDTKTLIGIGVKALNPNERSSALAGRYAKGDRTIKTLYAYSQLTQLYENDSLGTVLATELYSSFDKGKLDSQESYILTKNCVNSIENGFFKYWINNPDKMAAYEPENHKGEAKQILAEIVRKSIYSKERKSWNKKKIETVKRYILLTELSKNPDAFF